MGWGGGGRFKEQPDGVRTHAPRQAGRQAGRLASLLEQRLLRCCTPRVLGEVPKHGVQIPRHS